VRAGGFLYAARTARWELSSPWTNKSGQLMVNNEKYFVEWLLKFAAGNKYFPTPPLDMIRHVGSVNEENFREVGMILVCDLIQFGLLTNPNASIADIGCGCGRMGMFIVPALSNSGSYHGFDTWSEGISWATDNITSHYPNCVFKTLSDTQKETGYRADFFHRIDLDDNSCDHCCPDVEQSESANWLI
jgi:hypothetical protein